MDQASQAEKITVVSWTLASITIVVVGARLFSRLALTRNPWWDDAFIVLSLVRVDPSPTRKEEVTYLSQVQCPCLLGSRLSRYQLWPGYALPGHPKSRGPHQRLQIHHPGAQFLRDKHNHGQDLSSPLPDPGNGSGGDQAAEIFPVRGHRHLGGREHHVYRRSHRLLRARTEHLEPVGAGALHEFDDAVGYWAYSGLYGLAFCVWIVWRSAN